MKKLVIVLCFIFLITGCGGDSESNKSYIAPSEVYSLIDDESVYIIDVREIDEYITGHIPGAINIPVGDIDNIYNIVSDKESKVIVYCRSGSRSKVAYDMLISLGYKNVYDMGGILNYEYELQK